MVFQVRLEAFQNGAVRDVEVPDEEIDGASNTSLLDLVYHYGQNDIQPVKDRCSVSMGDVIVFDNEEWKVEAFGFSVVCCQG